MNNADKILFRCSELGYVMTSAKSKEDPIGETCKTHLINKFVSEKWDRFEEKESKFITKGNEREEDAITLLSRINKRVYKKNEEQLGNTFIKGCPDLFEGESVKKSDVVIDTKVSWSAHTFYRSQKALDKMYEWQLRGYMELTGAKTGTVAFCLVNGTVDAILYEKKRLIWTMNVIDPDHDEAYRDRCKQVEINHIFDMQAFIKEYPHYDFTINVAEWRYDIPMDKRLFTYTIERNDQKVKELYERIRACRTWMNDNLFK